jgi:hypothetical protein
LSRRPRVVVVTNPPIFAALVAYGCARLVGASVILDSHPGGFGVQGDRVAARLQRPHRWLVRRAAAVLVTGEAWGDLVASWGGTATVVHEAPPDWDCPPPHRHARPRVLVAERFAADEDPEAVVGAARRLPQCDFTMTGDVAGCPPGLVESAPGNVTFVGFLDTDEYRAAVADSDIVVTLTTEPTSVMRAAYEAVYARRPLVVSDWPLARALFPHAAHTANDEESLAHAVGSVVADYDRYAGALDEARAVQLDRWEAQRAALARAIERSATAGPGEDPSRSPTRFAEIELTREQLSETIQHLRGSSPAPTRGRFADQRVAEFWTNRIANMRVASPGSGQQTRRT